jgi:hypothetical protein
MKDAYELLNEALEIWRQNAMSHHNAGSIKKEIVPIRLMLKVPEYGYWDATNVTYDPNFGIVIEAKIQPYTSQE